MGDDLLIAGVRVIGTTAVVIDSASYLPAEIAERFGALVVPMQVAIGGQTYREFVDLDSAAFYRMLGEGLVPTTSQPTPGDFLDAYARAANDGASAVLSIHIGSALSGTINSARIAAEMSSIPVHIVDTAQASFIEGLCAWAACEALEAGATLEEAEAAALSTSARCGNVFIVRGLDLLKRGGRMKDGEAVEPANVPVLALVGDAVRPIGQANTVDEALDAMVRYLEANADPTARLRIGVSNGAADELAELLQRRILDSSVADRIDELVQYEIGPAVGSHTGPGCTGMVFESKATRP